MQPLKYFWIVTYGDGTALSQFDSDTGEERQWSEVDEAKVCKVAWAEFSHTSANKIEIETISVKRPKMHYVDFIVGEKILICRRNHMSISPNIATKEHRIEYLIGKGESGDNENIIVRLE